jgi:hypothetical protein
MTISETSGSSAEDPSVKTNREGTSELLRGLGISLAGAGIAAFVLRSKGTSSINTLSFVGRGLALYAAFQLVPFFRKHIDAKLNRTLRALSAVWIASVLAQGLSLATAFAKPLLIAIALSDFALRAVAFAHARSATMQLHRSPANTLVVGSIVRLATGAMMVSFAASGATRFSMNAGMIVVAELGATLLAAVFVETSLPKHFAAKTLQTSTVSLPETQAVAVTHETTDDSIDVVLDLRHADVVQQPVVADTVVDLREHIEANAQ